MKSYTGWAIRLSYMEDAEPVFAGVYWPYVSRDDSSPVRTALYCTRKEARIAARTVNAYPVKVVRVRITIEEIAALSGKE